MIFFYFKSEFIISSRFVFLKSLLLIFINWSLDIFNFMQILSVSILIIIALKCLINLKMV